MKRIMTTAFSLFMLTAAFSQTQKGNVMVGGDLTNLNLNFQEGSTIFRLNLTPKAAWFIQDNTAIGAYVNLGLLAQEGSTSVNYGVGAIGRKYFGAGATNLARSSKWFAEANVGIGGQNASGSGASTNGLELGAGPGFAYFLNQNIALEALAKYNLTVGFGSSTTNNSLGFGLGFQIYLGGKQVQQLAKDPMK